MALSISETTAELDLNLPDNIPDNVASEIKQDVGQYVIDAILENVGQGKSPVSGYGAFRQLSKDYAEHEKGGRRLPNLDLSGDMLNALKFEESDRGIVYGITDAEQAPISYGHNSGFKGHPVLEGVAPMRRFIPDQNEDLRKDIQAGVKRIVDERLQEFQQSSEITPTPSPREINTPNDFRSSDEITADLEDGMRVGASDSFQESALARFVRGILDSRNGTQEN